MIQNGPTDISTSTFHDNVADASVGPGGVNVGSSGFADGGGATLNNGLGAISQINVTYAHNVARAAAGTSRGGAIFFEGDGAGQTLTNATITGNSAAGGFDNRGGNIFARPTMASGSRTRSYLRAQPMRGPRTAARTGRCPRSAATSTAAISASSTPVVI